MKHERIDAKLSVERIDAQGLKALDAAEWDALSANALVENPFFAREVVLAALDTIDAGTALEALVVRNGQGLLLGLFPYMRRKLPFETADSAGNLYQLCRTPLIRREQARAVVSAWLDAIAHMEGVPRSWRFKDIDLNSQLVRLIDDALAPRSYCRIPVNAYKRPHLTRLEGGVDSHIERVLPKRRLKQMERNIRKLGERPIAMCMSLQAGHTAFTVKTTYDEAYRSFSPGLTLEYFIIKAFYEDGSMQDMDAATTVEGHVVAELWNGAKDMGTIFVGPDDWRTRAMASLDARAHGLRGLAKSVLKGPDGKIAARALKVMSLLKSGRRIPRELGAK